MRWSTPWPQRPTKYISDRSHAGAVAELFARFPFLQWAAQNGFAFPSVAAGVLCQVQSPAEAVFVRAFVDRPGVVCDNAIAATDGARLLVQERCGRYWVDAVLECDQLKLAIEVDGLAFHATTQEQLAADYLRQRRIVCAGYTVIRFTAKEVFANAKDCWRQVEAIVEARRREQATPLENPVDDSRATA